jgi:hypothetical protein
MLTIAAGTMAPPQTENEAPCLAAEDQEGGDQDLDSTSELHHSSSNKFPSLPLHIQIQESKGSLPSISASAVPSFTEGSDRGRGRRRRDDFRIFRGEPDNVCSSGSLSSPSCRSFQESRHSPCNIKQELNRMNTNLRSRDFMEPQSPTDHGDDEEHCDADCEASLNGTNTHSAARKVRSSASRIKRQRRRNLHHSTKPTLSTDESTIGHCHDVSIQEDCVSPLVANAAVSNTGIAQNVMSAVAATEKDLDYNTSNSMNSLLLRTEHPAINGREFISSRYNAWDSSPSTVCEDDEHGDANASLDLYFHPIEDEGTMFEEGLNVQKALFDTKDEDDTSIISEEALEITDESDLELTQRSRQIQIDLRVREMMELAQEAERAAEEGREKFVGSATKFELGLGLDVGNQIVLDSPNSGRSPAKGNACSLFNEFQCNRNIPEAMTPPDGKYLSRARSQFNCYHTDVKKVANSSRYFHQNSAPATVMARSVRVRSHNIPSLLTNGNIFSIAPTKKAKQQTISVLELRHIDEVIPTFKEMHSFMKMNFLRKGVREENLAGERFGGVKQEDELNERVAKKQKEDSPPILRQSSIISSVPMTFLPRVPSINMIMKTMSSLSNKEPKNTEDSTKSKPLDEVSKIDTQSYDDDADTDLSLEPDDMRLDCASFVSCGDASVGVVNSAENSVTNISHNPASVHDEEKVEDDANNYESHGCTLASELYDPSRRRRSISPLPQAPYCLDDDHLERTPRRNSTTSKSRWSDFWENISPVRKSISLPSPIRLQFPSSLEYKGGSWMLPNEILGARKHSYKRLSSSEQSLQFEAIETRETIDEPLEIEKDDLNNGVIISSQSYSQTILRSVSPVNDYNNDNKGSHSVNVCTSESVSLNDFPNDKAERFAEENINIKKEGILLCKQHCSKRSFRTSTTQMSGEDSQSSSESKPSCCSLQTGTINVDKVNHDPLILTVKQIGENNGSSQRCQGSKLESSNKFFPSKKLDDKPPLHPSDTQNVQTCNEVMLERCTSSSNGFDRKTEMLPIIEASISFRNFTETSSDLSINSANEGAEIYREVSDGYNSKDHDLTEGNCRTKAFTLDSFTEPDENHEKNRNAASSETNLLDQKTLFDGTEDDSSVGSPEELNKSMSFIDLIEKVPSVIGRFRPFQIVKKDNIEFKSDVDFVRNYFFTNMEQKACRRIRVESNLTSKPDEKNKCGTHPCIDLSCASVLDTAFRCLSTHSITTDVNDRNRSDLAPTKKYGNLNSSGMKEEVRVGQLLFEAPSLKVFKKVHKNVK